MKEIFLLKAWNIDHFKRIIFMNLNLNITSNELNHSLSEILMKGIFIEKEKYNIFFLKIGEGYFWQNGIIFWPFYPYMRCGSCILLKMVF